MLPFLLRPSRKQGTAKLAVGYAILWLLQTSSLPTIIISPLCTSITSFCAQVNIKEVMLPPAGPKVESWSYWNCQSNVFPLVIVLSHPPLKLEVAVWHILGQQNGRGSLRVGFWKDFYMTGDGLGPILLFYVLKANVMSGTKADILRPCRNMHKHKKPTC